MGGPKCKMFSHGPMSGVGGPKVLFGTYSRAKGAKLGPGGHGPRGPSGSATETQGTGRVTTEMGHKR